jgi:hypothetical protein
MKSNYKDKTVEYWLQKIGEADQSYLSKPIRYQMNNLHLFLSFSPACIEGFGAHAMYQVREHFARQETHKVISNAGFTLPSSSSIIANEFDITVKDTTSDTAVSYMRGTPTTNEVARKKDLITDTIMNAFTVTGGVARASSSITTNTFSKSAGRNITKLTHPFNKKFSSVISDYCIGLDLQANSIHEFEQKVAKNVELFSEEVIQNFFKDHPPVAFRSTKVQYDFVYRHNSSRTFESLKPKKENFSLYQKYMTGLQSHNGGKQNGSSLLTKRYLTGLRLGTADNSFVNKCYMVSQLPLQKYEHIHVTGDPILAQIISTLHPRKNVTCDRQNFSITYSIELTEKTLLIDMQNTNVPQSYIEPVSFNGESNALETSKTLEKTREEMLMTTKYDRIVMCPWYLAPAGGFYYSTKILSGIVCSHIEANTKYTGDYNFDAARFCIKHMECAFDFRCGSLYTYMQQGHNPGFSFRVVFTHRKKNQQAVTPSEEEEEDNIIDLKGKSEDSEEEEAEPKDLKKQQGANAPPPPPVQQPTNEVPADHEKSTSQEKKPELKSEKLQNEMPAEQKKSTPQDKNPGPTKKSQKDSVVTTFKKVFKPKTPKPTRQELLDQVETKEVEEFYSVSESQSEQEYLQKKLGQQLHFYRSDEELSKAVSYMRENKNLKRQGRSKETAGKVTKFYDAQQYPKGFTGLIETENVIKGPPVRIVVYFGTPFALESLSKITWFYKKRPNSPDGFFGVGE